MLRVKTKKEKEQKKGEEENKSGRKGAKVGEGEKIKTPILKRDSRILKLRYRWMGRRDFIIIRVARL